MLLKSISPFVSVDKIVKKDNEKYIHFITHLDDSFVIPVDWNSVIYTSSHIARFLSIKNNPIPSKFFKEINFDKKHKIVAPDKTSMDVIMFGNETFRGNVMFYFEVSLAGNTVKLLYSGPFVECRSVLINPLFRECVFSQIDELYIDNTKVHCTCGETTESVANEIAKLCKNDSACKIMLNIPAFGYEDLLYVLANEYKLKLYVGSMIKGMFKVRKADSIFTDSVAEAKIIVGLKAMTLKDLKRWYERQRITVVFYDSDFEINNQFSDYGLHHFNYSWHPSLFELYAFISYVRPLDVFGIYNDMPALPNCLKNLCKRKKTGCKLLTEGEYMNANTQTEIEVCVSQGNSSPLSNQICPQLPRMTKISASRDELVPLIAVIRPRTIEQEKKVVEPEEDSYHSTDLFRESLSEVDADINDDLEGNESSIEHLIKASYVEMTLSEENASKSLVVKRKLSGEISTKLSGTQLHLGKFIEHKRTAKSFSKPSKGILYSDDSS